MGVSYIVDSALSLQRHDDYDYNDNDNNYGSNNTMNCFDCTSRGTQ